MRMISRLTELFTRAKQIFQTEGLIPLFRQAFAFVVWRFFEYETLYLFEHSTDNVRKLDEADFMPKIDNFTLKIISTNHEADELEAKGLEFLQFRSPLNNDRDRLEKGAIALCIFIGRELAHIHWIAVTEEAMEILGEPPYRVDFSNNEACSGGSWTNPKYRRRVISNYVNFKALQFLDERGKVIERSAIATRNIASQRSRQPNPPKLYAQGRYLRILWWESWKEKPLP
jgi:hypothetical protein